MKKWHVLASEYDTSPFPIYTLLFGMTKYMRTFIGKGLSCLGLHYSEGVNEYIYDPQDWRKTSKYIVNKLKRDPLLFDKIIKNVEQSSCRLVRTIQKATADDLSRKSDKTLVNIFNKFVGLNSHVYGWSLVLPLIEFQETSLISSGLERTIKNKVPDKKQAAKYFTILTSANKISRPYLEEIDTLDILVAIQRNIKVKRLFKESTTKILKTVPVINPSIDKKIKSHVKKFAWLFYLYQGPPLTLESYVQFLKDSLARTKNPLQKLTEKRESIDRLKKEQLRLIKRLRLGPKEKRLVKMAQAIAFYKPWRREMQTQGYYLMEPVLKEIGKRLNLSLQQVRMMYPDELEESLLKSKLDPDKLNNRYKKCIYAFKGNRKIQLAGRRAQIFSRQIIKEKIPAKKELIGSVACSGFAKGRAVIVNSIKDMEKMKEGDILISFATNPNLMPAIRKAAAIVTDEGGLTSHAAIVSREFKIPCVIGTKIATKVLKDGDLVEVDADKGVVKKL